MKCQAYIDPETNIALEGEALVAASKNPDAPRCGYELEPGDMFCPSCGAKINNSRNSQPAEAAFGSTSLTTSNASSNGSVAILLTFVGLAFQVLALVDFAGMFFGYDFTGVSWSPIAIGLVGSAFIGLANKLKQGNDIQQEHSSVADSKNALDADQEGEASVGISEPRLDNPKHDSDDQSRLSGSAPVEPPRPRAKYRTLSIVLFIVFGIASFVLQYVNRQQRTQMNAYNSEIDRQICTALSASKAYGSLNNPSALKLLGATEKAKLDGMFGVKFGERIPSDVAVSTDATGLLMAFFEPESPDFTFDQYVKYMLPKSRVVCGIAAFFRANEKEKCREKYEQYKNEIGRRYGEMTTLRKKIGPSQFGTEEISQCIVECEGERFINLAVEKTIDGRYQLRLIVMDSAMYQKASAEIAQAASERIPLEGLFGRKLGARAEVSVNEVRSADGSILQPFEPEERFLDFDTYCLELLPQSRTICGFFAIHPCANESEASECFISAIRQLEKTFNQKMMDMTASCDTTHPDEDGEQTLRTAMLAFPRTVRIIIVQLVKNVNEGTLFVRVNALDQKLAATLQSEVLQVEESDGEEEKTETTSPHNEASALFGPIERLRRAAEQGDVDAQYNLGNKYHIGLGVDEDQAEAVKWYRKAAEQGNHFAQNSLGFSYLKGNGVAKNATEAVKWFRKAAEQGYAKSQCQLGFCYARGEGVAKDMNESLMWFRKAAEQGDGAACYEIGQLYQKGLGRKADMSKAAEWYRKGAELGDSSSSMEFGLRYLYGDSDLTPKDYKKAMELFQKSIKIDRRPWAYYCAGLVYYYGTDGVPDYKKAIELFKEASARGVEKADYFLGICYEKGQGVSKDPKEAVKWYRKAAEQGHIDAKKALKRLKINSE